MNIGVVTSIPTPYRDPFWAKLGSLDGVNLTVIYCAGQKADRPWGELRKESNYRAEFPRSINLASSIGWGSSCFWNPGAIGLLKSFGPDAVLIGGYSHLTMLRAIRFCHQRHIPWFLMSESWKDRKGLKGLLKRRWLRSLLKTATGGMPTGSLAASKLKSLGISSDHQFRLPNVPDISSISREASAVRDNVVAARLGFDVPEGKKILLFAARMIPKKRPLTAIESLSYLKQKEGIQLVFLGDGPLRTEAEGLASKLGLSKLVRFEGFVRPELVHKWMAIADVFLQPSSETWGVAPIEAAACGCRVIVTNQVGCYADVFKGSNEHRVLPEISAAALARSIEELIGGESVQDTSLSTGCQAWLEANTHEQLVVDLEAFLKLRVDWEGDLPDSAPSPQIIKKDPDEST